MMAASALNRDNECDELLDLENLLEDELLLNDEENGSETEDSKSDFDYIEFISHKRDNIDDEVIQTEEDWDQLLNSSNFVLNTFNYNSNSLSDNHLDIPLNSFISNLDDHTFISNLDDNTNLDYPVNNDKTQISGDIEADDSFIVDDNSKELNKDHVIIESMKDFRIRLERERLSLLNDSIILHTVKEVMEMMIDSILSINYSHSREIEEKNSVTNYSSLYQQDLPVLHIDDPEPEVDMTTSDFNCNKYVNEINIWKEKIVAEDQQNLLISKANDTKDDVAINKRLQEDMNLTLEEDRKQRLLRKQRREQEALNVKMNKSANRIQKNFRMFTAKKVLRKLKQERELKLKLFAEREIELFRENELRRQNDEALLMEKEYNYTVTMNKIIHKENIRLQKEELKRLDEQRLFHKEDEKSNLFREREKELSESLLFSHEEKLSEALRNQDIKKIEVSTNPNNNFPNNSIYIPEDKSLQGSQNLNYSIEIEKNVEVSKQNLKKIYRDSKSNDKIKSISLNSNQKLFGGKISLESKIESNKLLVNNVEDEVLNPDDDIDSNITDRVDNLKNKIDTQNLLFTNTMSSEKNITGVNGDEINTKSKLLYLQMNETHIEDSNFHQIAINSIVKHNSLKIETTEICNFNNIFTIASSLNDQNNLNIIFKDALYFSYLYWLQNDEIIKSELTFSKLDIVDYNIITNKESNRISNIDFLNTKMPEKISEINYCVEDVRNIEIFFKFQNLKKLVINVNKVSNLKGIKCLEKLIYFSAKDNLLNNISELHGLSILRYLSLDSNKIEDISFITGLNNLMLLSLNNNNISCLNNTRLPPNLQRLELAHNNIVTVPETLFDTCPLITHLDLASNKIVYISGKSLSNLKFLQTLILHQNKLDSVPSPLHLPCLKILWLNNNHISSLDNWKPSHDEKGNNNIIWPIFLPLLSKLYLQDNRIECIDNNIFSVCPSLQELDLSFNNLNCIDSIRSLNECFQLKSLSIHDNQIDVSSDYMTQLVNCFPSLEFIDRNQISNKQVKSEHRDKDPNNRSNKLIQLIQMIQLKYLAFSNKERISKGDSENSLNWDNELIRLLQEQILLLKAFAISGEDDYVDIFISYRKNAFENKSTFDDSQSSSEPANDRNKNVFRVNGLIGFQAVYRGYIVRKKIKYLLKSIRYEDNELDELMQFDMNENDFLFNDIEESLNDNNISWSSNHSDSGSGTMVYGDHIRKRVAKIAFPLKNDSYLEDTVVPSGRNHYDYNRHTLNSRNIVDNPSRPSTNMSSTSNRSLLSAKTEEEGHIMNDDDDDNDFDQLDSRGNNKMSTEEDWGISDPRVVAAMKKRSNRIKTYEKAQELRELDKDPKVRYQKFLRTAATNSNTNTSGSFGGKPKTVRNNKVVNKKSNMIPAWMNSNQKDDT